MTRTKWFQYLGVKNLADRNAINKIKSISEHDTVMVSLNYEFYGEDDELLPNQRSYASLIGLSRNDLHLPATKMSYHTLNSILKENSWEKIGSILKRMVEKKSKGRYTCIDYNAYHENRPRYYVLYLQYKLKEINND